MTSFGYHASYEQFAPMLENSYWLNFIRTLDELSIERLTEAEQQEVFETLAPDENVRIYGRGIRRRIPPIVHNDRQQIEMIYSFFFGLPGTPILMYGEEIGVGDNLDLKGRMSVRTPMQWNNEENGGFSEAAPNRLARPIIDSGNYSYKKINVEHQQKDPDSLLNWMKKLIQTRKAHPILGTVRPRVWDTQSDAVFGLCYQGDDQEILILHNFSSSTAKISLGHSDWQVAFSDKNSLASESTDITLELIGFGYRWLCREEKVGAKND